MPGRRKRTGRRLRTFDKVRASSRYGRGLRRIMTNPIDPVTARTRLVTGVAAREDSFLALLERGVYARPENPYRKLLDHTGIGLSDVRCSVRDVGLEATLASLYDVGVYVTPDEFKGLRPIRRKGIEIDVRGSDFDNPLADQSFRGHTSGSRGEPSRVFIGFDLMEHEAAYYACLFEAHNLVGHPIAFWHASLHTALKNTFRYAKIGRTPEKSFTPRRFSWRSAALKEDYVVALTLLLSRLYGRALPRPQYVPRGEVLQVVLWLADKTRLGTPAVLETNHSSGVRICLAAKERGIDIKGTVFHFTGEPYTPAKAEVVAGTGARALDRYANVELGIIGAACAKPSGFDDLHLVSDKLALIQREKTLMPGAVTVNSLVFTTLVACTPKLMLNVESGDYAAVSERDCGCPLGEIGFTTHLSSIRAYDKLTSEGVTFVGSNLLDLLEKVLPGRYGGGPTDYQLLEEEMGGLPRVSLVIRPSVGAVDETAVLSSVFEALEAYGSGGHVMAEEWRQGNTLRIVRRDPYETGSAKILPLHVVRASKAHGEPGATEPASS